MDRESPFVAVSGGVSVNIRLTPKASRNRNKTLFIEGPSGDPLKRLGESL